MRRSLAYRVAVPAVAAGLILSFSDVSWAARMARPASTDCVFQGRVLANGRWCSYRCDRAGTSCAQQSCWDGQWIQRFGCVEPFCTARCG
jgi:hypothetical protein